MQEQGVVAGRDPGGSGTDPAADVCFIQNLLSQKSEALHFFLVNKHLLLPALKNKKGCFHWQDIRLDIFFFYTYSLFNANLYHLQLCILSGSVRPPMTAQLRFGLHAFQPAVETLELLLHLPEFGQCAVELSAGVGQPGLVEPPLLLQTFQSSVLYLGQT